MVGGVKETWVVLKAELQYRRVSWLLPQLELRVVARMVCLGRWIWGKPWTYHSVKETEWLWDPREASKWLKSPSKIASVSEGTEAAKMLPCTERIWETWANRSFVTNLRYDTAVVLSCLSHVRLFSTLWTVACQAPLSMGFSRQEYWSELPCPPPGDLPDPWIEPKSLRSPVLAGGLFTTSTAWEALIQQRAVQNNRQLEDVKTSQQKPFWK